MKKITKKEEVTEFVPKKRIIEKTVFIAEDGAEYDNPKDCQMRDEFVMRHRRFNEIPSYPHTFGLLDCPSFYFDWYKIRNEEDLGILWSKYCQYQTVLSYGFKDKKELIGQIVGFWEEDMGDSRPITHVVTLDNVRRGLEEVEMYIFKVEQADRCVYSKLGDYVEDVE